MLEAIIKYPQATDIQSKYWEETIKPDLDLQYETFVSTCSARGRGAKSYWETKGKDKDNLSIPQVNLKDNSLKDKDKNKDKNNIPTLDDVKSYAQERNRLDLAEKFYDFFNATDWVDSNGKKVKNWKGKFITWESHTEKPKEKQPETWWIE